MPNGESKNWIRFQATLESFFFRFGHWPSESHLTPSFIAELEKKFSAADFGKIRSTIRLTPDADSPFLALDDLGNRHDYRLSGSVAPVDMRGSAHTWLGVGEPDYYD